tara:strand:- start:31041 stop:31958 length:918 start_codon:yes stop_codon:yes gene_type:complete
MRNTFADELTILAKKNKNIVLLVGDIGNKLFDNYKKNKNKFFNCGVAEANMNGVASGLARLNFRPITYTITPFNTFRCIEQIKIDICYPKLPVIIVGTGSGLSYSALGATHHSMEDIAMLRSLPNLQIVCPGDPLEVRLSLQEALKSNYPTYIRLGKKGEPQVHKKIPKFKIGKGITLNKGKDLTIISIGNVLGLANNVRNKLIKKNLFTNLISLHTIKPLDTMLLKKIFSTNKLVVIIEEHSEIGGSGSAILEWCYKNSTKTNNLLILAGPDKFLSSCGDQKQARKSIGLNEDSIIKKISLKIR